MPLFGQPGERIAYEVHRGSGGPPLVLLHGFTASKASFVSNIESLSEHFTVVTIELLGHGDSESPADPTAYAAPIAIERILELLDHLGYEKVLFCGHSLGGAVALRLALDAPERLAGLVVINSNSAAGTPAWRESARRGMEEMARRARAEGTAFLRHTRLYPAHSRRLPPEAKELLTRDFDRLTPDGFAGTAEGLVVDVNCYERLPELEVPMLLVLGERDTDVLRNAPPFIERLPAELLTVARLPDAGHAANLEQPELFHRAMVDFATGIGYLASSTAAPAEKRRGQLLTALGALMVAGGLGMLAAAFLMDQGAGEQAQRAAAPLEPMATRTPTPVQSVAGTRSAGNGGSIPANGNPTSGASGPGSAGATTTQNRQPPVMATATPPPPTPTPIPATPTATATLSGPFAAISGPAKAQPGQAVTFANASGPPQSILRQRWTVQGVDRGDTGASLTVTFPQGGCYSVGVTVVFATGEAKSAAVQVAVGGAACQ